MYDFAVIVVLALATVKVVDFLSDNVVGLKRLASLLTFVGALGAVWLLNYSLFERWAIDVRNHAIGVWVTGFLVAGMTVPWRAVFSYLTHNKAEIDETLGDHSKSLRPAA